MVTDKPQSKIRRACSLFMGRLLLLITTSTILTSCANRPGHYVIGVAQCSEDSWRAKLNEELKASCYLYDNVSVELASADDDDNRQIEQINSFIDRKVDLLIVSPNQMNSISKAVDRAYDSGIPVILLDRKTGSGKYTAFIGADNVEIGRQIGRFVAQRLGGNGRVVEIMGLAGSSPAIERHRGFTEVMTAHPGINVIKGYGGDWLHESGRAVMDSILATCHDRIDCVFGHNDRMAMGAREAMKADRDCGKTAFVGIDALPTADGGIARVADSTLTATCIYPTRGDLVIRLAMDILEGRPYEKENTLKTTLVTHDNAAVMLMQAEEIATQNGFLETLHDKVDTYLAQYNHQKVYMTLCVVIFILLIIFFVMTYRTILMRRRVAEETANAKLVFFTNMSHELRTPLTLIADPVERMLGDDNLTSRQRERLQMVNRNARMLQQLVSEILEFRRLQNGKMTLTFSRFDLAEQLARWADGFRPTAEIRGITITVKTDCPLMVCSDIYKVERICYNLLSNAVKYTREGGSVTVTAIRGGRNSNGDGGNVHISVSDTGIGIPKDKIRHVFDRFFQVRSNPTGGTGIGLALVKAFAEAMHGSVTVTSDEGHGSTFTVVLPDGQPECDSETFDIIPAGEAIPSETSSKPVDVTTPFAEPEYAHRPSILIVDDNDDIRAYIASLLSDRYNIAFAADGREGLDKAVRSVPDMIVCDVMMPVMDGLEMCRRVKAETATSHIPVLMLTARSLEEQRAEGYDCGADAYITKPFSGSVLTARVENLLENRRRLRELFAARTVTIATGTIHDSNNAATNSNTRAMDSNMTGICPEEPAQTLRPDTADTRFVAKLYRIIAEHMADSDLSVETIGTEMGLSRVQLYRKVKAITGHTPVELLRLSRLNRAEELLRDSGRTVSEISYEVGFSSPSYFIKCYKEHFGHTPNDRGKQ